MNRRPLACGFALLFTVAACSSSGGADDGLDTVLPADAESDTTPDDAETPDAGAPLAACDGPARIYVETEAGERELVSERSGDTVLRGYASCDGDVDRFRVVFDCGGDLTARLTWANADSELAVTLRADEVDGGTLSEGPATVTLPMATLDDADGGGDYALDVDVSCVSGEATTWQLDLDTASTGRLPKAANGWPEDLLPEGWQSCEEDRFPFFGPVRDQYGHSDVTAGQFYGDMTVYAVSAVWCYPCRQAAADARELHDRLEARGSEWGFTLVELLVEDGDGRDSFGPEAKVWADQFDLVDPVLVGPGVDVGVESCIDSTAIPTLIVVDPLGEIRRVELGSASVAQLARIVENAWRQFRDEHPEWVSPRCAGVAAAERLCPCDDVEGHGDADGDAVSDVCDVCPDGSDRPDYDGDGVPNACDETPGELPYGEYRSLDGIAIAVGVHSPGDGTASYTPAAPKVAVAPVFGGHLLCGGRRSVPAGAAPIPTSEEVIGGWTFPAGGEITPDFGACGGLLDPALWGPDPMARLAKLPEGIALFARCPLSSCEGREDPAFERFEPSVMSCSEPRETCETYIVGASLWSHGSALRTPEGNLTGYAWALASEGGTVTDQFLESSVILADFPAGDYTARVFIEGSDIPALLEGL